MPILNGIDLEWLPTMGVGSYASPSWLTAARRLLRMLYDLAALVNRELRQLVAVGVTFIQVDEPSAAGRTPQLPVAETVALFNKTVEEVQAKIALHITCDCGFSASSRHLARAKLDALVAGAAIVRKELGAA